MGALFDPLPIGPTEQGGIEVAPGKAADFAHDGVALSLALFELVREEDDLRDHGHISKAEGVVADRGEDVVIGDAEALAEDSSSDGAMEHEGAGGVFGRHGQAAFPGETKLVGRGEGAKEVVPPGGQLHAGRVEVPASREVERFAGDAANVADEASRARRHLGADGGKLLGEGSWH